MVKTSSGDYLTIYSNSGSDAVSNDSGAIMFAISSDEGQSWQYRMPVVSNNQVFCTDGPSSIFGEPGFYQLGGAAVAIDSNDIPHVVYIDYDGTLQLTKMISGCWTVPEQPVNDNGSLAGKGYLSGEPSIAIDGNDEIHIAYPSYGDTDDNVYIRYTKSVNGSWTEPLILYDPGSWEEQLHPQIDVDENGVAHIIWESDSDYSLGYAQVNSGQVQLHQFPDGGRSSLAVGNDGNIFVAWAARGLSNSANVGVQIWVSELRDGQWTDSPVHDFPLERDGETTLMNHGVLSTSLAIDHLHQPHLMFLSLPMGETRQNYNYQVHRMFRPVGSNSFEISHIEENPTNDDILTIFNPQYRYSFHHRNGGGLDWMGSVYQLEQTDNSRYYLFFDQDTSISMDGDPMSPTAAAGTYDALEDQVGVGEVTGMSGLEFQRLINRTPSHPLWHPVYNIVSSDPEIINEDDVAAYQAALGTKPGDPNWNPHADWEGAGLEAIALDGSGSFDPDGTIEKYTWEVNSPGHAPIYYEGPNPIVRLRSLGDHIITLTVENDSGQTAQDTTTINLFYVDNAMAPLVFAGHDQDIDMTSEYKAFSSVGTSNLSGHVVDQDTDQQRLRTEWVVENCEGRCGQVIFENAFDPQSAVTFNENGIYTLGLIAFDGDHETIDYVNVSVGINQIDIVPNPDDPIVPDLDPTITGEINTMFNPGRGEKGAFGYAVPHESEVEILIYDRQGKEVIDLLNTTLTAGSHIARWDGRDSLGNIVTSGVYNVLIRTVSSVLKTKLVVVN